MIHRCLLPCRNSRHPGRDVASGMLELGVPHYAFVFFGDPVGSRGLPWYATGSHGCITQHPTGLPMRGRGIPRPLVGSHGFPRFPRVSDVFGHYVSIGLE